MAGNESLDTPWEPRVAEGDIQTRQETQMFFLRIYQMLFSKRLFLLKQLGTVVCRKRYFQLWINTHSVLRSEYLRQRDGACGTDSK